MIYRHLWNLNPLKSLSIFVCKNLRINYCDGWCDRGMDKDKKIDLWAFCATRGILFFRLLLNEFWYIREKLRIFLWFGQVVELNTKLRHNNNQVVKILSKLLKLPYRNLYFYLAITAPTFSIPTNDINDRNVFMINWVISAIFTITLQ